MASSSASRTAGSGWEASVSSGGSTGPARTTAAPGAGTVSPATTFGLGVPVGATWVDVVPAPTVVQTDTTTAAATPALRRRSPFTTAASLRPRPLAPGTLV